MDYKPVASSNIAEVGYDPETKTMGVRFKDGAEYHYEDVSAEKHKTFVESKSLGAHFHKHVRPHHKHKKIDKKK